MQKLVVGILLTVVALAPLGVIALSSEAGSRPEITYYFIDNIYDKQHQVGEVVYWADYNLEDGTYIGSDSGGWSDRVTNESSLINTIAMNIAAGVGGAAGWSFGGWFGGWVASQVAIEASYAAYALGLGALAAGPWIGLVAGVAVATV